MLLPLTAVALAIASADDHAAVRLNNLGVQAHAKHAYAEAEEHFTRAVTIAADSTLQAVALSNLAEAELALGKLRAAEGTIARAVRLAERIWGTTDARTAKRYSIQGLVLSRQGQYAEAERAFRRALAIRQLHPGEANVDRITTLNNLADCLVRARRDGPALNAIETALAFAKQSFSSRDTRLGPLHTTHASVLMSRRDWAAASESLQQALAVFESSADPDVSAIASVRNNLGVLALEQGDPRLAERYYRGALGGYAKALGEDHPEAAKTLSNLAESLERQGRHGEAELLYQLALQRAESRLTRAHPLTLRVAGQLHRLFLRMGKKGQARSLESRFRRAFAERVRAEPRERLSVDYRDLVAK